MARKTTGGRSSHRWRCRVALRFVSSLPKVNRQIVLFRGINLGPRRRVPMAELRNLLEEAGFSGARTYVQSGNVVLSSGLEPTELAEECSRLIEGRFGFQVPVVVRTRNELA